MDLEWKHCPSDSELWGLGQTERTTQSQWSGKLPTFESIPPASCFGHLRREVPHSADVNPYETPSTLAIVRLSEPVAESEVECCYIYILPAMLFALAPDVNGLGSMCCAAFTSVGIWPPKTPNAKTPCSLTAPCFTSRQWRRPMPWITHN